MCTGVFTTSTSNLFLIGTGKLKVLNYGVPLIFVENDQSLRGAGRPASPFMPHVPAHVPPHLCCAEKPTGIVQKSPVMYIYGSLAEL